MADCFRMRIALHVPADFEQGPVFTETLLKSLRRANPDRLPVTLELGPVGDRVGLIAEVPSELKAVFVTQFLDVFPGSRVEVLRALPESDAIEAVTWRRQLWLTPDVFPLTSDDELVDRVERVRADPLAALFSALRPSRRRRLRCRTRLTLRPARPHRIRRAERLEQRLRRRFPFRWMRDSFLQLSGTPHRSRRLLSWLLLPASRAPEPGSPESETRLRQPLFEAWLEVVVTGPADAGLPAADRLREVTGAFGQFTSQRVRFESLSRHRPLRRGFLLSPQDAALMWHPPTGDVQAARLDRSPFREFEPPLDLPHPQRDDAVTAIGRVQFRQQHDLFGIHRDDRRRHLFIPGKTGMGKSTLLMQMCVSDMQQGHGLCLIDPHGDLAESVLARVPKRRRNDIVSFDAAAANPLPFNPLEVRAGSDPVLVAEGVLSIFQKLFALESTSAPRLLHILRNSLLTLVEQPESTLLDINRLLLHDAYRKTAVSRVSNELVRSFWIDEFAKWKPGDRTQYIASLQNKLGAMLSSPQCQVILGQPRGKLHLRPIMDEGRILIVNLSKGRTGEAISGLLGSLLISSLQTAAMSRADVVENERRDFFVFVDEFQNFATESFSQILSEARKYRLSLTLSNQFLDQIADDGTLAAVFGNVGSLLCFQVGAGDAEVLAEQLGAPVTADDLRSLPQFQACARLLINGLPSRAFSLQTIAP